MKRFFPMHMRVATVMTVLSLFAMFFFAPAAQAQVISPQRSGHTAPLTGLPKAPTRPNASGGGCRSTYSGNAQRYVDYTVCSSYLPFKIVADGYVTFGAASPGLWQVCRVYMYLYNGNKYVDGQVYNCLSQARSNAIDAYFGFGNITWSGAYHTDMIVYYDYHPDGRGYYGPRISSPIQYT